jgi:predicted PurR-regulated permease PerM
MTERPGGSPGAAARRAFFVLGTIALVVAALSWGQKLFVTLALAVLLTLVLGPVVIWLERRGLPRVPAVLSTALLAFLLIGFAGWAVVVQVTSLLADLPQHKSDIRAKLGATPPGGSGPLAALRELLNEVETNDQPDNRVGPIVRVEAPRPSTFAQIQPYIGRALQTVTAALAVVLLVISLLLFREDTRNRLIRLAGRGRLTVTTQALDEAGRRLSGYLLGHASVNAGFGATIGFGLFLLGVPYPVLWGMLAAAFRFVPSVGVWLVAPLPAALAYIGGTAHPALVLAVFLVLELVTANLVEPWVCGRSAALAPVPLFLAITFWTGLWGIIGLVLATPVTVCLAVLGKYVPALRFLAILLGSEAALRPAARYYQRLLARDRSEAKAVTEEYLAGHPVEELFEHVLLPALVLVRRSRRAGELRPEDEEFILRTTREIVDGLGASAAPTFADPDADGRVVVLGIPAVDGADETALHMLRHLARSAGVDVVVAADGFATPAAAAALAHGPAPTVFIAAVGPRGLTEACYLCRRLRVQHPGARILVGRWGRGRASEKSRRLLLEAAAYRVVATLREGAAELIRSGHPPLPVAYPETV